MEGTEWLMVSPRQPAMVRIFRILVQEEIHWSQDGERMRKTRCEGPGCAKCAEGERRQTRWTLGVIDRADGKPKLMQVGAQLMSQITEFATGSNPMRIFAVLGRKRLRNPENYDFTISREGEGRFGRYRITHHERKPLTKGEQSRVIDFLADIAGQAIKTK